MADGLQLLIDGDLVDGDARLDVVNPATGRVFATVPRASQAQALAAVAAAKAAQPAWAATPLAERVRRLLALADAMERVAPQLARTLVAEQGKPLAEAEAEVGYAQIFIRHFRRDGLSEFAQKTVISVART